MKSFMKILITLLVIILIGCNKGPTPVVDDVTDIDILQDISFCIFVIVDGTDTRQQLHNIPKVDVVAIEKIIAEIVKYQTQPSYLWVTYVDTSAANNKVEFLKLDRISIPEKPKTNVDSLASLNVNLSAEEFTELQENAKKLLEIFMRDSINAQSKIDSNKVNEDNFLLRVKMLLHTAYNLGGSQWWSDIFGSTNIAIRTLNNMSRDDFKKYVLFVSDGVDNVRNPLDTIPSDIKILLVNGHSSKHSFRYAKNIKRFDSLQNPIKDSIEIKCYDNVKCYDNLQNAIYSIFEQGGK